MTHCNPSSSFQAFEKRLDAGDVGNAKDVKQLEVVPDPQYRRFRATVDLDTALALFRSADTFRHALAALNEDIRQGSGRKAFILQLLRSLRGLL